MWPSAPPAPRRSPRRRVFFFKGNGDHRDLHPFPTRRSSDLFVEGRALIIDLRAVRHGYDAGRRVDRKPAARAVRGQAIGHGRTIDVARADGNPDSPAVRPTQRHPLGCIVCGLRLPQRPVGPPGAASFFLKETATTVISTPSLHDALPIYLWRGALS